MAVIVTRKHRIDTTRSTLRRSMFSIAMIGLLLSLPGHGEEVRIPSVGAYTGESLLGLKKDQLAEYEKGFSLFIRSWKVEEGLGPLFSGRSCASCHRIPMPGGSGTSSNTFVFHTKRSADDAEITSLARFSIATDGSIIEQSIPDDAVRRKTPGLFGLGLLAAIEQDSITRLADPDDKDSDGISGRAIHFDGAIGRFGWRGNIRTIEEFVESALTSELGLTVERHDKEKASKVDSERTFEVSRARVRELSFYIKYLSPPPPEKFAKRSERGSRVFTQISCGKCHTPEFHLSSVDFGRITIRPYTDLLLHDMGKELQDPVTPKGVHAGEFRTPPLWGVASTGPPYLHDGRARSLEEAIEAHGGEAAPSRADFKALPQSDRDALIEFLKSL